MSTSRHNTKNTSTSASQASDYGSTSGADALQTMADVHTKLMRSLSALQDVKGVEVGTSDKECVWEDGHVRLYHFTHKAQKIEEQKPKRVRIPVLIVYALVNRPYMLDLQPDRSLVQQLLANGLDVYMIDWGYPTRFEHHLTLDDYVSGFIDDCANVVRKQAGLQKINLLGVCQGGTFATIYAALFPKKVQNLITIATPIDFSVKDGLLFQWAKDLNVNTVVDSYGVVPPDFLNAGFVMLKPFARLQKYMGAFQTLDDDKKFLNFLRMEQWIFDSPGQPGECYRQFITDLYQENKLIKGTLRLGKKNVHLKNITMPLINIFASDDHIVPHSATKALNKFVGTKDNILYEIPGGHIGIFVGSKAQKELAPAIAAWLSERDRA